nr:DUF1848 family protein [Butyrivibrio sp.]
MKRFREGFVLSRNPLFPNIVNRIDLNPDTIDVVVFCSKDYSPIHTICLALPTKERTSL